MPGCHCGEQPVFDGVSNRYRRTLGVVIGINASMFVVEFTAGFLAGSQALKADSLDFLGDSVTYAISLVVIGMPLAWRARAALFKGLSLAVMGFWVLASTILQSLSAGLPGAHVMGAMGFAALLANLASVLLLLKYRDGDANVRSVWLCSRNDAIGNVAVMIAASGVWATRSATPDLVVAGGMAALFLYSSILIVRQATAELRAAATS